jgi:hypothetical protein
MELKEFIKETLQQIFEGIHESQVEVKQIGGIINPPENLYTDGSGNKSWGGNSVSTIDFEIALQEQKGTEKQGRIGVLFSNIGLNGHKKTDESNSSVNRIKFSVPVIYPLSNPYRNETTSSDR